MIPDKNHVPRLTRFLSYAFYTSLIAYPCIYFSMLWPLCTLIAIFVFAEIALYILDNKKIMLSLCFRLYKVRSSYHMMMARIRRFKQNKRGKKIALQKYREELKQKL